MGALTDTFDGMVNNRVAGRVAELLHDALETVRALEPTQVVDIGHHPLMLPAADRRDQRHATGRHFDDLAGKLATVRQHVAAEQVHAHALIAPAFLGVRRRIEDLV